MARPEIALRPAALGDLDAIYGLYAEVQALHAEAEPALFRQPVKDARFRDWFEKAGFTAKKSFMTLAL